MKAKKVLGLLLSVAMIAGLMTGCGNDGNGESSNGGAILREASRQTTAVIPTAAVRQTAERITAGTLPTPHLFISRWIRRYQEILMLCAGQVTVCITATWDI